MSSTSPFAGSSFQMSSSLKNDEDPVSERKKLYISERKIPALFEVDILLHEIDISFSLSLVAGSDGWSNESRTR